MITKKEIEEKLKTISEEINKANTFIVQKQNESLKLAGKWELLEEQEKEVNQPVEPTPEVKENEPTGL